MAPSWQTKPWKEMNAWEKTQRVQWETARQGFSSVPAHIAKRLGVTVTTVSVWLNPDYRADRMRRSREYYRSLSPAEKAEEGRIKRLVRKMSGYKPPRKYKSKLSPEQKARKLEMDRAWVRRTRAAWTPEQRQAHRDKQNAYRARKRLERNLGGNDGHQRVDQRHDQAVSGSHRAQI